jgi:hypothetical protein
VPPRGQARTYNQPLVLVWVASFQRSGNTLTLRTLAEVYGIDRLVSIHEEGRRERGISGIFLRGWSPKPYVPPPN